MDAFHLEVEDLCGAVSKLRTESIVSNCPCEGSQRESPVLRSLAAVQLCWEVQYGCSLVEAMESPPANTITSEVANRTKVCATRERVRALVFGSIARTVSPVLIASMGRWSLSTEIGVPAGKLAPFVQAPPVQAGPTEGLEELPMSGGLIFPRGAIPELASPM